MLEAWCVSWPINFLICSPQVEVLRFVRSHLHCTIRSTWQPSDAREIDVCATTDGATIEKFSSGLGESQTRRIEGYTGQFWDFGLVDGQPTWGRRLDAEREIVVQTGEQSWLVAAPTRSGAALGTVRVCRELARMDLAHRGALNVHGALAWLPGHGGLLLAGPSRVGKTTLALCAAQQRGYVVSSDHTQLLHLAEDNVLGVGSPSAHRIAPGTLSRLDAASGAQGIALLRDENFDFPGNPSPDKRWITPLEAEVILGIPAAAATRIDRIVLLATDDRLEKPGAEVVTASAGREQLRAEFRTSDSLHVGFWLAANQAAPEEQQATASDLFRLVERVPHVRLTWNPVRHGIADALHALERC